MGHFKGYFEGAKTFLTPKLSRAQRGAILGSKNKKISLEMAHYVVCPKQKKIITQIFKISGALVFLCPYCAMPHPK
jgi:hypothetical protein